MMIDFNTIQAKIADETDIDDLEQLINAGYRGETSRKGWTTEADILGGTRINKAGIQEIIDAADADLHCFRQEGIGLLACVYLKTAPSYLYVGMLTVNPELQAAGLGKFILNYAEEEAKRQGKSKMHMTVIHVRKELIAWYERRGYKPTGETEPWIDEVHIGERKQDIHFVVLEKNLPGK